jgi:toxin FitB
VPSFLLDTNVVSELVRPVPEERVAVWFVAQPANDLYLSAVTLGELVRGIVKMPGGRRREALSRWVEVDLPSQFEQRILPFDQAAAAVWGEIMGEGDRRGRRLAVLDAQIAAIAVRHGLVVATRNNTDFQAAGVAVLNPWDVA